MNELYKNYRKSRGRTASALGKSIGKEPLENYIDQRQEMFDSLLVARTIREAVEEDIGKVLSEVFK